jgi:hypothetical protein
MRVVDQTFEGKAVEIELNLTSISRSSPFARLSSTNDSHLSADGPQLT